MTGKQDDCTGYQDQWRMMDDYSRATFATLGLAAHNLQIEQPRLFRYLAAEWLRRTDKNKL